MMTLFGNKFNLNFPFSVHSRHDILSWKRLTFSRWQWSTFRITRLICNDNRLPFHKRQTLQSRRSSRPDSRSVRMKLAASQAWNLKSRDVYFNTLAAAWMVNDASHIIKYTSFRHHLAHLSRIQCHMWHRQTTAITLQTAQAAEFNWFRQSCQMATSPSSYLNLQLQPKFQCWCQFHQEPHRLALLHLQAMSAWENNRHHLSTHLQVPQAHPTSQWIACRLIRASSAFANISSTFFISNRSCTSNSSKDLSVLRRQYHW